MSFIIPSNFAPYVSILTLRELGITLELGIGKGRYQWEKYYSPNNLSELTQIKEILATAPSTPIPAGSTSGDVLDPTIRNSDSISSDFVGINFEYKQWGDDYHYNGQIHPKEFSQFLFAKGKMPYFERNLCRMMRYGQGQHFDTFHFDTLKGTQCGTFLCVLPGGFEGGDLVFSLGEEEFVVQTSMFDQPMVIAFGQILHKCTPITRGVRYVIKTTLESSLDVFGETHQKSFTTKMVDEYLTKFSPTGKFDSVEWKSQQKLVIPDISDVLDSIQKEFTRSLADIAESVEDDCFSSQQAERKKKNLLDALESAVRDIMTKFKTFSNAAVSASTERDDSCDEKSFIPNKKSHPPHIFVLGSCFDECTDLTSYPPHYVRAIQCAIKNDYTVIPYNLQFKKMVDFESKESTYDVPYPEFSYTYLNEIQMGKQVEFHSEYNDQSGNDTTTTYECTCLLVLQSS